MLFNGKRVYKNVFFLYIKLTFMIRSQPFVSRNEGKSVGVFIFVMENGAGLWLLYNFMLLFCHPICRHRVFSIVFYKA